MLADASRAANCVRGGEIKLQTPTSKLQRISKIQYFNRKAGGFMGALIKAGIFLTNLLLALIPLDFGGLRLDSWQLDQGR